MVKLETLRKDFFVGLDLGQAQDPTALVVLERDLKYDPGNCREPAVEYFSARHLQRWQLGTAYPKIVADVVEMMNRSPLEEAELVIDGTGVGRAVVDLFREALPASRLCAATITAGHASSFDRGWHHVPKKDLVGHLQVLLSSRRLQIADVPERKVLLKELENFRVKQSTATGHESFEAWREGDHDDLVLALGLAAWRAKRSQGTGEQPVIFSAGRGY